MSKDVLFVHNNFPGQFAFLANALKARGFRVAAIAAKQAKGIEGVPMLKWEVKAKSAPDLHRDVLRSEADILRGRAAGQCAVNLRNQGFNPRLIIGHPGWGECTFLKEVWPNAQMILYGEYYYRSQGGDVGFDSEWGAPTLDDHFRTHAKNAVQILQYSEADRIVSPTQFQADRFPSFVKAKQVIIHEGVDTAKIKPIKDASFTTSNGVVLTKKDKVVTFINRRFEPMRGFHIYMRAMVKMMKEMPDAKFLMIGMDAHGCYGREAPKDSSWAKEMLKEVGSQLDPKRIWFTGHLPHDQMHQALNISSAHVYMTYPFVLSWSLLEAMASECLLIGSDTAPVRDALTHNKNALLFDFFDKEQLADTVIDAVNNQEKYAHLRTQARKDAMKHWERSNICEPQWLALLDEYLGPGLFPVRGEIKNEQQLAAAKAVVTLAKSKKAAPKTRVGDKKKRA
jgi:glycosyltransferase involved in cell wall biosynthesis